MTDKYYEETVAKLEQTQAGERVFELVRTRLVECGWSDEVRLACKKLYDEGHNHNFDELAKVVVPTARAMMPDAVKQELVHELEQIMVKVNKLPPKKSV